jgi:hypothetical protein
LTYTATGTGGVLTVPTGVSTSHVLYASVFAANADGAHPSNGHQRPAGLRENYQSEAAYTEGVWNGFLPTLHDGRSEYVWPDSPGTLVAAVFISNVDGAYHDGLGSYDTYGSKVETIDPVSEPGSTDPMRWGEIQLYPDEEPRAGSLFVAQWSARNAITSTVTIGAEVMDATAYYEDTGSDFLMTYTRAWPGAGSDPFNPPWRTDGWVVARTGLPPLRNAQRDDARGNQRTSRQLSNRNAAYL